MDPTEIFPGSWSLVKRNLPTLLGAGVGAIAGSLAAGRKAYRQVKQDQLRSKFVTWSERKMPVLKPARRIGSRRYVRRRYRRLSRAKGMALNSMKRIVRSTAIGSYTLSAASSLNQSNNITLNQVQTTDLTGIYRLFRLRKVVLHLVPRVDSSNSGVTNNYQAFIACACDPESTAAPSSTLAVTAYDNSYQKFVTSGDRFTYTFYPKVTNTVDLSGAATAVGSYGMNPWLRLDSTGITVPHLSVKFSATTGASTSIVFDYYYDLHFDVKGIA